MPWTNVTITETLTSPGQRIVPGSYKLVGASPEQVYENGWPKWPTLYDPATSAPSTIDLRVVNEADDTFTVTMASTGPTFAHVKLRVYVEITDPGFASYTDRAVVTMDGRASDSDSAVLVQNSVAGDGETASLAIEKGDGDAATGTIAHAADAMAQAQYYAPGETRDILITVQNNGTIPLSRVSVTDELVNGENAIENLQCTFPGHAEPTVGEQAEDGSWTVEWAETFSANGPQWAVGDRGRFTCTAP